MIVNGFRAALDFDTYPLSNLIRLRFAERAKPGRGKPNDHFPFFFFFCKFSRHIIFSNAVVSAKSPHSFSSPCSTEAVGIAHRPPRSLYCENSRRQTDRQTDTMNDYCNPRFACAPRVNNYTSTCSEPPRKLVRNGRPIVVIKMEGCGAVCV